MEKIKEIQNKLRSIYISRRDLKKQEWDCRRELMKHLKESDQKFVIKIIPDESKKVEDIYKLPDIEVKWQKSDKWILDITGYGTYNITPIRFFVIPSNKEDAETYKFIFIKESIIKRSKKIDG